MWDFNHLVCILVQCVISSCCHVCCAFMQQPHDIPQLASDSLSLSTHTRRLQLIRRCLQIQDAAGFANEVLQSHPSIPAFIGGQSLGGLISAHVALLDQSKWSGLVLCSAAMNIEWTLALRWVSQLPSLPFLSLRLLLQDCKLQLKTTVVFGAPDTTWHIYNFRCTAQHSV